MKKTHLLIIFALLATQVSFADEGDAQVIKECLAKFGKHPFNSKDPVFSIISSKVKVFGIGGETADLNPTKEPALVLIKPNVTVLSKNEIQLLNPNGWYCIKGQVSVLGKSVIKLHCDAKLASSEDGVTVLGGGDNGVTVLGSSRLVRTGCKK